MSNHTSCSSHPHDTIPRWYRWTPDSSNHLTVPIGRLTHSFDFANHPIDPTTDYSTTTSFQTPVCSNYWIAWIPWLFQLFNFYFPSPNVWFQSPHVGFIFSTAQLPDGLFHSPACLFQSPVCLSNRPTACFNHSDAPINWLCQSPAALFP